jgi:hypothetical protein
VCRYDALGLCASQAGDVRMVQAGEDASLPIEAVQQVALIETGSQRLDRDLLAKQLVDSSRQEDDAHSTPADFADDRVDAKTAACPRGETLGNRRQRRTLEKRSRAIVGREQIVDFAPDVVVGARREHECRARGAHVR